MLSTDLVTFFYREIKDKERPEDRLRSFIQYTQDVISGTFIGDTASVEKEILTHEFSTWTLILNLLETELIDTSETQSSSQFLKLESSIRFNRDLLISVKLMTWLEQIKMVHLSDRHVVNWTRSVVSMSQRVVKQSQELDPDAAYRGLRDIDGDDAVAEKDMVKYAFEYVRAGRLREAQIMFADCGQPWRAASIGGLLPFFDFSQRFRLPQDPQLPSFMKSAEYSESTDAFQQRIDDDFTGIMGNSHIRLYLIAMWQLAEAQKFDKREDSTYERALYGSLCGHYEAMSTVCKEQFYDHFWALMRTAVFIGLDEMIPEDDLEPSEGELGAILYPASWPRSFEGIARKLHSCHPTDTKNPFISFQLAFITSTVLEDWNSSIDSLVALYEHYSASPSPGIVIHLARFCTHVAIILLNIRTLDIERKGKVDNLILTYIRLILGTRNCDIELVSHYIRYIRNPNIAVLRELVGVFVEEIKPEQGGEMLQRELSRYYSTYLTSVLADIIVSDVSRLKTAFDHHTALQKIAEMERGAYRIRNLMAMFPPKPNSEAELNTILQAAREAILTGLIDTGEIILHSVAQHSDDRQVDWLYSVIKAVQLYRRFIEVLRGKPAIEEISSGYDPRAVIHRGIVGQIYQRYQDWPASLQRQGEQTGATLLELIQGSEGVRDLVLDSIYQAYEEIWVQIFKEWLTEVRNAMVQHR
jgi:hypothetical protein